MIVVLVARPGRARAQRRRRRAAGGQQVASLKQFGQGLKAATRSLSGAPAAPLGEYLRGNAESTESSMAPSVEREMQFSLGVSRVGLEMAKVPLRQTGESENTLTIGKGKKTPGNFVAALGEEGPGFRVTTRPNAEWTLANLDCQVSKW
jgi:hypothetical protein